MSGETVGSAIDDLNLRYAEIATMLSGEIEEAEYTQPDLYKLARLWTANNDAHGYALLGDPAVRLPVAPVGAQAAAERPVIAAVTSRTGSLPPPPLGETARRLCPRLTPAPLRRLPRPLLPPLHSRLPQGLPPRRRRMGLARTISSARIRSSRCATA